MKKVVGMIRTIVAVSIVIAASAAPGADFGDIMPLGDSITDGWNITGGYRDPLYGLFTTAGDSFTFVGSATDSATKRLYRSGQHHHEGHSGYIIDGSGADAPRDGLDENLETWIGPSGAAPNIILLMIGTNDLGTDYQTADAPARLNHLIDDIFYYRPNVSLYVASLTPTTGYEAAVEEFNAAVPDIVAAQRAGGHDAHYVNMHDALATSDLADGLHPNSDGYAKMADVWYDALTAPEPSDFTLVVAGAVAASLSRIVCGRKEVE